ncbi:MAG: TldD/PmbA family protein [Oscillospiraceae bacterium]|nr:TldD/PmbA family protein [Oscillospiraceae bacterium]
MDYQSFKTAVIAACAEACITEYELYYQSGSDTSIGVFAHEINEFSSSEGGGVCFRCIVEGKMGYASTPDMNPAEAKALVARAADNAACLETEEQVFLCEGGKEYKPLDRKFYDLPTTEEMIRCALDTQEKIYAADAMVIDGCQTQVIAESSDIAIYNSKGLDLTYSNKVSGLVVAAVVSDGKEMSDSYEIKLGKLSDLDTDALTKKAVADAKLKLGGEAPESGAMPVIFNTEAMCSLLGVFSSIFNSENAQKGLSALAGKEGEIIAASCVTLVDDPFHPENPSPMNFDGEGCPTYTKKVIENGKLNTLLYNMKTAAVAGRETTGNASKAGYDSPVGIRPFTMYLENGTITEEALLQKAGNGVYITDLGGLHAGADAISGDFSLQSSGFKIENGKKTDYIKAFTVAGNFYELLKNIVAMADNCHLPRAMGSTAFGAPSVLVEGLSVAGK